MDELGVGVIGVRPISVDSIKGQLTPPLKGMGAVASTEIGLGLMTLHFGAWVRLRRPLAAAPQK